MCSWSTAVVFISLKNLVSTENCSSNPVLKLEGHIVADRLMVNIETPVSQFMTGFDDGWEAVSFRRVFLCRLRVANYFTPWFRTRIMISSRRCYGVPDLLRVPSAWVLNRSGVSADTVWFWLYGLRIAPIPRSVLLLCCFRWNFLFCHNAPSCTPKQD